jgi:SAM-dependent methyltransferase
MSHRRLPQVISQRYRQDRDLLDSDNSHWYVVKESELTDFWLERFVQLECDEETWNFIHQSVEKSDWLFTQMWHNLAKTFLSFFYEKTDINAILNRGSMFVVSRYQILKLLDKKVTFQEEEKLEKMIDLGAGDGKVTEIFKPFFKEIYATEASKFMQKSLRSRRIQTLDIPTWTENGKFDLISCLNLLDRCDEPFKLLEEIRSSLKSGSGVALIALVIPYSPFVEFPQNDKNAPIQKLDIPRGRSFEHQAQSLGNILESFGFSVISWTRVPYLCEGDLVQSLYSLDDVLFAVTLK